jgi:ankyrin repeat protein
MSALEVAAQNGWSKSVKVLLAAGADPNLYYTPERTPLDRAIRANYTEIVEMLRRVGGKTWVELAPAKPVSKSGQASVI